MPPTPDSAAPVVSVRNLSKRFTRVGGETVVAADDISFDLHPGELMVLLGPSGGGKTTLLRCIAGLEQPDAGTILLRGEPVYSSKDRVNVAVERRRISMVFQSYALWPHMTVFDNVAYPLRSSYRKRMPKKALTDRVSHLMEATGIGGLGKQYPNQLSGGQQQRVALCRALAAGSSVVLFDEPMSNIDARVRENLRLQLIEIQRALGFAALFVTHDRQEAMVLADTIAVLDGGRMAQLGSPRELYEQPSNTFVANFIGPTNELQTTGTVTVSGADATAESAIGRIQGRVAKGSDAGAEMREWRAVWRPEACLIVQAEAEARTENLWRGTVEASCYLGLYVEYVIRVGPAAIRSYRPASEAFDIGQEVWVSVRSKDIEFLKD